MIKSAITNNTYRNILFAFTALSVLSQLFAAYKGDIDIMPIVSLIANIVVLVLFFRHDRYLKPAVQVAAALTLVNSILSLYSKGHFIELFASGSFLMLLLTLFFHFGPGIYLLLGSRKHIQMLEIDEYNSGQTHLVNSNLKGILNRGTFNLIIIPFAIVFNFWPITHYSDGGCDGGTCMIYIFIHGVPLAVATVLTIIAINKALRRKGSYPVFAILAFLVNLAIILPDYGYRMDALKYPGYIIAIVLALSFVLFVNAEEKTDASEPGDADAEKRPIIGWRESEADKPNDG